MQIRSWVAVVFLVFPIFWTYFGYSQATWTADLVRAWDERHPGRTTPVWGWTGRDISLLIATMVLIGLGFQALMVHRPPLRGAASCTDAADDVSDVNLVPVAVPTDVSIDVERVDLAIDDQWLTVTIDQVRDVVEGASADGDSRQLYLVSPPGRSRDHVYVELVHRLWPPNTAAPQTYQWVVFANGSGLPLDHDLRIVDDTLTLRVARADLPRFPSPLLWRFNTVANVGQDPCPGSREMLSFPGGAPTRV